LVAPLEKNYDVAIGSRYVEGGSIPNWAWHRHLLSRGGNIYASKVLGLGVADSTAGYRAYSAGILRKLDLDRIRAEGYGFQIEMTYRAKQQGARIVEVPITFVDRAAGESKMSSRIVFEALALVTWWGLGRVTRGLRHPSPAASAPPAAPPSQPFENASSASASASASAPASAPASSASPAPTSNDPLRSV